MKKTKYTFISSSLFPIPCSLFPPYANNFSESKRIPILALGKRNLYFQASTSYKIIYLDNNLLSNILDYTNN
ncbi:hypothetical protein FDUTEX481_06843 [Tolypothrix sp. PCC 7601]|nr:hypothetical protein FDUTEX481_06843 [Tolypothrix sp. PCC 7601]